ncbi:hypothetical protein EPUS_03167 [Endocarpon pusillum Z07020]|uniref:NACHT domain-containing protein n=1 Tax=Endocarpon pusillum (strain Z07020 / HMAS-L-300199) TaxID=1263415 RepID=U1GR08_ENDPU|nr:uncharacterized protein EPUS_03167 [Endocarpon pusillum Z07020]ERF74783.1 hypothetical protein EPUS_03167 [Endocarpon pusillum Z07020]
MDPFSAAAGIAGLISLGVQVTGSLVKFYTSYKGQEIDATRTTAKLQTLLSTFQLIQATLQSRTFQPNEQDLIKNIESSIHQCDELIHELEEECKKCEKASATSINATIRATGRRAAYPFRQSTLQKLDEAIGEILQILSLALDVLQLRDHKNIQDDIAELKSLLEVVRATQVSATIRTWFNAPDVTINHNAACAKRHPGRGIWFVKGSAFKNWLTRDNSFLWLNGFAGCGKSVLCSTAIQYTFRHKRSDPGVGIAFFYFTFNDESKQDESAMLRALILQLSGQLSDPQTDLARLHGSYSTSVPPVTLLISHLRQLVQKFNQVYILLDALDESQREQVLDAIETMLNWSLTRLHVLVTSRDEPDIRDSLSPLEDEDVTMRNAEIDQDISYFISDQLNTNRKLRKLRAYHDRIQKLLAERSQGVFRWVECQLKSLMECPQSEYYLDQCLQSLPRTLDETYERILCSINKSWIEDARRILTLLCFSSRPLAVQELIDAVAIQLHEPAGLNLRRRLHDADDFRLLCPGLIDVGAKVNNETHVDSDGSKEIERIVPTLRIAHFSVQEYLESDRIREQQADAFALESASAHAEIAEICLVYLLEPGLSSGTLDQTALEEFPLARFAARFSGCVGSGAFAAVYSASGAFGVWVLAGIHHSNLPPAPAYSPPPPPPSTAPVNVESVLDTPPRGSAAGAVTIATTTTTVDRSFPTPDDEEKEEEEEEALDEAFIPPLSTAPAVMTQSRAGRKRAPTMKALEAEKAPKRGTGQGKGRGRGRAGREAER